MTRIQKIAAGVVALVAVSGAGAAVAATQLRTPQEESRAVVNDAARELGVTPERLSNALKTAMKNRIDEAVTAGRLTKAEGDALKARIDQKDVPLFGPGGRGHHGPGFHRKGHGLDAAAKYLGMTEAALRTQLESGKTLAQVAKDRDKAVNGLVDALIADKRERIQQEVKDGRLTQAQADRFLAGIKERTTDMVNGRFPRGERGPRFHRSEEFRGGPPMIAPAF